MVKLYAFTCGTVTGEFAHLMEGGEDDITAPIPAFLIEHPKEGCCSTPGCMPIASTTPLDDLARGSPGFSVSAFSPGKKSVRGSKRLTQIPARSTSSSIRIFISIMSAATR
jgi:hypothetical protein